MSVVTLPADGAARISAVKAAPGPRPVTLRSFEEALEQMGYSRREARSIAAKGFGAVAPADESTELIAAIEAATNLFQKA